MTDETFDLELSEQRQDRLRSVVPAGIAVVMLFGVVLACAFALREVVDVVVWSLGSVAQP